MFLSTRKSQRGFSLVELMVVVAIIGVLASIAVPSINKYLAKARQSEAKTNLSSIYTSEKAFYAEYTAYHTMFGAIGYSPEGKLRYNVGFSAAGTPDAGTGNGYNNPPTTAPGNQTNSYAYCNTSVGNAIGAFSNNSPCTLLNGATNVAPPSLPTTVLDGTTFRAAAISVIHTSMPAGDVWTIDQNKDLRNATPGIP